VLDLAVVLLALMVCASMSLLAWTLGVSITGVLRRTRGSLVDARLQLAVAERRLREMARAFADARAAERQAAEHAAERLAAERLGAEAPGRGEA
jgi:hypothetical protein